MTDPARSVGPSPGFFAEMRRRRVWPVLAAYLAAGLAFLQGAELLFPAFAAGEALYRVLVWLVLAGLPVALVLAWVYDFDSGRIRRTAPASEAPPTRRVRRSTVVAVGLSFTAAALWWLAPQLATARVAPGSATIAVLPWQARGAEVEVLAEGIVDLLSRNLDEVGSIRAIDPLRVLRVWSTYTAPDVTDQLELGRELEAGSIVTGSVVAVGGRVQLDGELRRLDGSVLATTSREGAPEELLSLIDSVSVDLLRGIWRSRAPLPQVSVGDITSGSPDAIRAYLRGEALWRKADVDAAKQAFSEAVRIDSTFALSNVRLANLLLWNGSDLPSVTAAREGAQRWAERLPVRTRRRHDRYLEWSGGAPGGVGRLLDSTRAFVRDYPDDLLGRQYLADFTLHSGSHRAARLEAIRLFEEVLARDSLFAPAYFHLVDLSLQAQNRARFDSVLTRFAPAVSTEVVEGVEAVWRVAAGTSSDIESDLALSDKVPWLLRTLPEAIINSGQSNPGELLDVLDQVRPYVSSLVLAGMGRSGEALQRLGSALPSAVPEMVIPLIGIGMAPANALDGQPSPPEAVMPVPDLLLGGTAAWGAREWPEALAVARDIGQQVPEFTEASLALEPLIAGDTLATLRRWAELEVQYPGPAADLISFHRLWLSTALEAERPDAIEQLGSPFWPAAILVRAQLILGQAEEAEGNVSQARRHYRRFLELLVDADPFLEPLKLEARAGLARLATAG